MKWQNPIIPGFHPDPSICRVGRDYYLVTSSFEYFPGVPLFHSRDLVHWQQIGHCLTRPDQLNLRDAPSSGGIYAPTLRHHDGRFYMITTNTTHGGNFYVHTDDPTGEWSDPVRVRQGGIDPSLLFDPDGTVQLTSNGLQWKDTWGIYQSTIDIETGELLSDPEFIWGGTGGRYPEAPHLYRIDDLYYLMIAEGGTEYTHMETIARSEDPLGPFEPCPHNPILSHRSRPSPIQATGHGDLIQDHNGNWWMVFLAVRPHRGLWHHLGRETFLAPVAWDTDGWPVVGNEGTVNFQMEGDVPEDHGWESPEVRDDFDEERLRPCWNFLRNPDPESWSLSEKDSTLTLHGGKSNLNAISSPTFIGRRQQHFRCRARALLDFRSESSRTEAGLAVRMDERHHYEMALTRRAGKRTVILRCHIGPLEQEIASAPAACNPVELNVTADREQYTFSFSCAGDTAIRLGTAETRYLSKEVAGGFTGVYFGMYATGNGRSCNNPAHFDWFEYLPLQERES